MLADITEGHAIIARRYSTKVFGRLLILSCLQPGRIPQAATESGGAMTFYDPTLYGRDEEEEFGESGAYSESLEEDFEEEEEEEEEGPAPEAGETEPEPAPEPPTPKPAPAAGGGGGGRSKKPIAKKKTAAKKAPAKKAVKKAVKKKAKTVAKRPAKKKGKKRR